MNIEQIKELYYAQPFVPFDLVLTNGTTLRVAHPEFISFAPDKRTLHLWEPRGGGKRVDAKLVTALNEDSRASTKAKKRK